MQKLAPTVLPTPATRSSARLRPLAPRDGIYLVLALLTAGCGEDPQVDTTFGAPLPTTAQGSETAHSTSTTETSTTADATESGAGEGCASDLECPDDQQCTAGTCCDRLAACGELCCADGEFCSFGACVAPGQACVDSDDCADGDYCEYALGSPGAPPTDGDCASGATPPSGACLPAPPECPPGEVPEPGEDPTCLASCELELATQFDPVLAYQWPPGGGSTAPPYADDVMMTPLVLQLDDDNCDGLITAKDIPELVFTTFVTQGQLNYQNNGTVRALSLAQGQLIERWNYPGVVAQFSLAGGDIDGDGVNEIVGCGVDGRVHAINGEDGSPLWQSPPFACFMPSLADIDYDGDVEVVDLGGVLDGATGAIQASYAIPPRGLVTVADVDADGFANIVSPFVAYEPDGSVLVDTGQSLSAQAFGMPAIVDLDLDGVPEVASTLPGSNGLMVWRFDDDAPGGFDPLRPETDLALDPGGPWNWTAGMGPITAGDVDGDGRPDLGFTAFRGYMVLNGAKLADPAVPMDDPSVVLWSKLTDEDNGSTGSAMFDFDGDGRVEVLYNDSERLHIYDGASGATIAQFCNTSGTVHEYPVVADVDNDGHADIVLAANAWSQQYDGNPPEYTCEGTVQAGLRVYSSASKTWVRTRSVWNQHTYHVSNVEDDGAVPIVEPNNWTSAGLNNFRQNKQPGSEFAAPDAVVSLSPVCPLPLALRARVQNLGEAAMGPGVEVSFWKGEPESATLFGTAHTTLTLYPAQSEDVIFELPAPDPELESGEVPAFAVVDDPLAPALDECRVENNRSAVVDVSCGVAE